MEGFLSKIKGLTRSLNIIAGTALTFMMLLTVADVILRSFRRPIPGTYELVAFLDHSIEISLRRRLKSSRVSESNVSVSTDNYPKMQLNDALIESWTGYS